MLQCLDLGKMRRFRSIKSEWGIPKFLPHKTFKEASNGYLVDDKCVFGAEIFVIKRQGIGECLSMVKSNDAFNRVWKIHNFFNVEVDWFSEEFTVGDHKWYYYFLHYLFVCCAYCSYSLLNPYASCRKLNLFQKGVGNIRHFISQYTWFLLIPRILITIKK